VFHPKVAGAWILHELSRDCELDFFALLSSGAAIWGSKGLGHYGAANHFLDALSHYRRGIGLPAVSINWGPWGEVGLSSIESRQWLAQIGLDAFTTREGLHAFAHVLGSGAVQVAAAKVDWRTFKGVYVAKAARRFLDELDEGDTNGRSASAGGGELAAELARTIPGERRDRLVAYLQGEVAAVLGIHSRRPDPRQGFAELGMDSLMAVELRNRLQHALGRQLPPTLAFDYPTIDALAAFAITTVLGLTGPALEGQAEAAESDVAEIAPLSDQDVKELIAGELEALSLGGFMGENS
jgi:acyl carrier protein